MRFSLETLTFPESSPASGAGGREFKSLRSDHCYPADMIRRFEELWENPTTRSDAFAQLNAHSLAAVPTLFAGGGRATP